MRSKAARRQHWAPTDFRIGEEPGSALNDIDWLVDNCEAYESLVRAVRDARESIWISQLAFDADCKAYPLDDGRIEAEADGESVLDAILATSEEHRVSVRILLNSTLLLNTKRPLVRFLTGCKRDAGLVEVRGVSRFPQLLHAKMVVIDGRRAFLMGSPFVNGYWDAPSHQPVDHRRPRRELGGRPVHDVSVALRGEAVHDLAGVFARLWKCAGPADVNDASNAEVTRVGQEEVTRAVHEEATPEPPVRARAIHRPAAERGIEVVTTEPDGVRGSINPGSRRTLDALLEGIGRARSLIYIEHQYLSSRPVVEALRTALNRSPALELVLVLNQNPDVTAYRRWQNARLSESGLLAHPRVGVFALWSAAVKNGARPSINQVFVHSKVVIADDEWAMVGSANLDGASLDSYGDDFSSLLGRRVFRDVRNFDVSVVFTSGKSAGVQNPIRGLRERLWIEHLGRGSLPAMKLQSRPVAEWKALAAQNVAALNAREPSAQGVLNGTFILPYSTSPRPRGQLADVGVRRGSSLDLQFDPGWLEVNFSPNWVRNMFL